MKKNRKEERKKEVRSLQERRNEIWRIRREDCWVELEKPEPHGWYIRMVLRDDIARREDVDVFWEIKNLLERRCWDKEKRMGYKHKSKYPCVFTGKKNWHEHMPWSRYSYKYNRGYGVDYKTWEKLEPKIQKWFVKPPFLDNWGGGWCICTVPEYYWNRKFEKCYATHYQELDSELESELDWIDNRLYGEFYEDNNYGYGGAKKFFVNCANRTLRQKSKNAIKKMGDLYYEEDSIDFSPFVKNVRW